MEKKYDPKNSCAKTILYCDRSQYGAINVWQNAKMKWHIFFCPDCKNYAKKNSKLSETIQKSKLTALKPNELEEIKRRLDQNVPK